MSNELTPLEALKRIRQETIPATYNQDFDKEECCKIIEKSLKALDIIREQASFYVLQLHGFIFTNEEYDLLKEVLL